MNLKYEWINTLFIILPLSLCVFIIVDIAYNERIWELDTFAVKARLQALGITVAYFYLLNYIFQDHKTLLNYLFRLLQYQLP